jgi:Tfp pilus assembly protein PilX
MNGVTQLPRQRGVVLIFALIVLLILTIGAVALMRSMNNSLFGAGNLAFRRDLVNQGEEALALVVPIFKTGALVGATTASNTAFNYSATILPVNAYGIPCALLSNATGASSGPCAGQANNTFSAVGVTANDLSGATSDVTIRYVIDRMCTSTGASTSALCAQSKANPTGGTGGKGNTPVALPSSSVFRVSVRVTGARNTQVFLQSSFTVPGT